MFRCPCHLQFGPCLLSYGVSLDALFRLLTSCCECDGIFGRCFGESCQIKLLWLYYGIPDGPVQHVAGASHCGHGHWILLCLRFFVFFWIHFHRDSFWRDHWLLLLIPLFCFGIPFEGIILYFCGSFLGKSKEWHQCHSEVLPFAAYLFFSLMFFFVVVFYYLLVGFLLREPV